MAVAADEPFGVVELGPGGDSSAGVRRRCHGARPEALLFECANESFGASVGFGFANKRSVIGDPEPVDRPEEVFRPVLGSPVVSQADSSSDIGFKPTEPIDDGVVDGLERSDPVATLGDVGPGFGRRLRGSLRWSLEAKMLSGSQSSNTTVGGSSSSGTE